MPVDPIERPNHRHVAVGGARAAHWTLRSFRPFFEESPKTKSGLETAVFLRMLYFGD
jgi:hypothetical protein